MNYEVRLRLKALAADFSHYLQVFDERVPFGKPGQREYHSETIAARKNLGSAAAAIDDERFMQLLWETLLAWGIGSRGSRLVPYSDFCRGMRERKKEISALDGLCIDDPCLNVDEVISRLWHLKLRPWTLWLTIQNLWPVPKLSIMCYRILSCPWTGSTPESFSGVTAASSSTGSAVSSSRPIAALPSSRRMSPPAST